MCGSLGFTPSFEIGDDDINVSICCYGRDAVGVWVDVGEFPVGGIGLKPAGESSVLPIDMPTLPTGAVAAIPVGEDADAAGCAKLLVALVLHVPEEVPAVAVLSPSKSVDDGEFPVKPAGGAEPMPEQLDTVPAVMPSGIGLTPDVESSVAPNGIPVNPTGAADPRPSGAVTPSGVGRAPPFALTCAAALPQPQAANNSEIMNDLITSAP